jgi:hypothetical protein
MVVLSSDPALPDSPRRGGRWWIFVAVASLLLAAGIAFLFISWRRGSDQGSRTAAPDPRLEYVGPYQNIVPGVGYVADDRCTACHADIAHSYAEHSMGRSLCPAAQDAETLAATPATSTFQALGSQFLVDHADEPVRHRRMRLGLDGKPAASFDWEVQYAVGSGTHGHSYFSERDGYLFQTPVSWYAQKKVWDLSPGFTEPQLTGRAVFPECLFCHANHANYRDGSVNRYATPVLDGHAIGCQRCHGPGELHVTEREKQAPVGVGADVTIVNPRRLEWSLREAVCEQCHLEGETRVIRRGRGLFDFRPGLPLEQFWSVFLPAAETDDGPRAVGHVEQMYKSRCFQATEGADRLGCISCHDPHQRVSATERVGYFRNRCLHCHEQRGCSLPRTERLQRSAQDSCIECHMPPYGASDIPHTASTDHRILRRAQREDGAHRNLRAAPPGAERFPLVSFYRDRKTVAGEEDERDLALAIVKQAVAGDGSCQRALGRALPLLEAATERGPDDFTVAEAHGQALARLSQPARALAVFEWLLARAPERERALVGAAATAELLGKNDAALGYWRRAVAANPFAPDYHRGLATLLVKKELWDEGRAECEAWIRLDPFSADARSTRILCLLAAGATEEARAEFARIEGLAPKNLSELEGRFSRKLK